MEDVRCFKCGKLLARLTVKENGSRQMLIPPDTYKITTQVEIKCPRCKTINVKE